jgi:hypothetical protein
MLKAIETRHIGLHRCVLKSLKASVFSYNASTEYKNIENVG